MAGGPKQYIPKLDKYPKDICWIGVDRGVIYLMEKLSFQFEKYILNVS